MQKIKRAGGASACWCLAFLLIVVTGPVAAAQKTKTSRPREVKAIQAGEVIVVLNEQIFNALLEAVFTLSRSPTFPLGRTNANANDSQNSSCASEITLLRETEGLRTAVRFRDGRITVPVAFKGNYAAPLVGCLKFQGWSDTNLNLAFEQTKQVLVARIEVREVHLKGLPSMLNSGVTGLIQDALDARINPIEILRADQVSARLPIKGAGSEALRLRAREVRHEVVQNELRLHIVYEFIRDE